MGWVNCLLDNVIRSGAVMGDQVRRQRVRAVQNTAFKLIVEFLSCNE